MQCCDASSKTNTMPAFGARDLRNMRPRERVDMSAATSARMRCMPALSWMVCGAWAKAGAAARRRSVRKRINEKGRERPCLGSSKKRLLLFHRRLFLRRRLVGRLLGRRFFLGRLGRSGLLLGRLGRSGLLLHRLLGLLVLRDRRDAYGGKRRCEQYGNELLHS